jgi:DNA-binding transcriptional regulator YdaS (Cro superfamily)
MKGELLKNELQKRKVRLAHVAVALGVNKSQVTRWVANGIPAERVVEFERVSGISRTDLRPDLFVGLPSAKAIEAAE